MTAVVTRAPQRRGRAVAAWVGIGLVVLLVGLAGVALSGIAEWAQRNALDPDSPGPNGTRAVAELLRGQGVDVVVARDRDAAQEALRRGPATLALPDTPALSDDAVSALTDAAADTVLLDPRSRTLRLLLPGSRLAGAGPGTVVEQACDLPDAGRAGPLAPGALFASDDGDALTTCYPAGDGWGLIVADDGDGRRAAVDARVLFTNEHLADDGNAALALNLLGRHDTVVWYAPGLTDTDLTAEPGIGELTPGWVSPAIVLLIAAAVAAGFWRGRRFGPLVVERLPVTVRASETTEGRARLYGRSRDRLHAADQLRIGALGRMSRALGLGPSASAAEIADAAAARTGADRGAVRGILLDELPQSDADLVALSDRIARLESAVHAAVRPGRNAP